jgi:UDP-N-acetylmuramyl pentapeptide phosphotransferase/UDP-N-acetylglucosamine-1-phosphate transferase
MLYFLFPLADQFHALNLLRYITFRSGGAVVTALLISFVFGPRVIAWLKSKQGDGQPIRTDGPEGHLIRKKGTPTMGGFLILLALTVSTLLWADLRNPYVWITLLVTVGFGLIGFFDDYKKLTRRSHHGLPAKVKLLLQIALAGAACLALAFVMRQPIANTIAVPFVKNFLLNIGWFFLPFGVLVIAGASNAVNLTDGLDGLAIGPSLIAIGCFGLIAYLVGNTNYSDYRRDGRCRAGLSVVQRAARERLYGRYRLVIDRRRPRHHRDNHQARIGARHYRRVVRTGGRIGHRPGRELQDDRPPRVPHGAAAPSFRAEGVGGTDHRHPVLDHRVDPGDRRTGDPEIALAPR